jgi:HPt (histidine-containing phosphotransfer) domain-containing protein
MTESKNYSETEKSAMIEQLQALNGFELSDLLDAFSDDPHELIALLMAFKAHNHDSCTEIKTTLEQNDIATAKILVHKLKGTAGNIGAVELALAASNLDKELRSDHFNQETLLQLEANFQLTINSISTLV